MEFGLVLIPVEGSQQHCIVYAVSVLLCDAFVRCNRPCECL